LALSAGEVSAAKQAFEQAKGKDGEAARVAYVTKLATMFEKSLAEYEKTGVRKDDAVLGTINSELGRNPMPAASDGKVLSKLILGDWNSPRRTYRFKANGSYGTVEDGKEVMQGTWHIQGNRLIEDDGLSTIILLSKKYLIFSTDGTTFFHSRAN
jgi:hypothetical protein